jgi:hypothetical protein
VVEAEFATQVLAWRAVRRVCPKISKFPHSNKRRIDLPSALQRRQQFLWENSDTIRVKLTLEPNETGGMYGEPGVLLVWQKTPTGVRIILNM